MLQYARSCLNSALQSIHVIWVSRGEHGKSKHDRYNKPNLFQNATCQDRHKGLLKITCRQCFQDKKRCGNMGLTPASFMHDTSCCPDPFFYMKRMSKLDTPSSHLPEAVTTAIWQLHHRRKFTIAAANLQSLQHKNISQSFAMHHFYRGLHLPAKAKTRPKALLFHGTLVTANTFS